MSGSPTPSASTQRGGEAIVAYPAEPATLDPFAPAGDTPATRDLVRLVMPGLYRLGPGGRRERWLLAEEPAVSQGPPFTVTVTLREDAVWSDGRPIVADDLRFTWRQAMDPRRAVASRDGFDRIRDIVAETPKRARIVFRQPYTRWADLFSAGLGVLPAHALAPKGRLKTLEKQWPVSGGPFVLKRWRPGLDLLFERNPRAWPGTAPALDRIRVVFVPDATAALELLRQGRVHLLGPYHAPDWTGRAAEVPGATVSSDQGATLTVLLLNTRARPLRRRAVRRALADSLDRKRLAEGLVQREGSLTQSLTGTVAERPAPGSSPDGPFTRYGNLNRAQRALAADGWRGSPIRRREGRRLALTIAVPNGDELAFVVARALQFQAARAGFDLQAIGLDPDRLQTDWLPNDDFDAAVVTWRDPPSGAARAHFAVTGTGPTRTPNPSRLADPTLDRLFTKEDQTASPAGSAERLAALVPAIPLYTPVVSLVAGPHLQGPQSSAAADGPFWNAHTWTRA